MSFANKVAIVTGASSGIGAATAVLFAKEGANVVMVGRNKTKLKNVTEKVTAAGKAPLVVAADLAVDSEAERVIKETIKKYGKLDILVNNAGFGGNISDPVSIIKGNLVKSYDEVMRVNVRAVIYLTSLAAPHLIASKGNVVNISSVVSRTLPSGGTTSLAYHISKAALDHFTKGAAKEFAPSGVRVNSINPGPVATDFLENAGVNVPWDVIKEVTALKRVSAAEEIGELILYLAGEKARGITGSIYISDNGYLLM